MPNINLAGKPAVFSDGKSSSKLNSVRRLRRRLSGTVRRSVRSLRLFFAVLLPGTSPPQSVRTSQMATTIQAGVNATAGIAPQKTRLPSDGSIVWLAPVGESKALRSSSPLIAASPAAEESDIQKIILHRRSRLRVERDIALARFGVLLSWIGSFALVYSVVRSASFFTCAWTLCAIGLTWSAASSVKALSRETSMSEVSYN